MKIDIHIETATSTTARAKQVAAMFDCPVEDKCSLSWQIDFPYDEQPWNVGLVVGPSGSGKSTVLKHVWGEPPVFSWTGASVVDDFPATKSMEEISAACGAVGFNTIPAWMRPFKVLSNGEQFRVDLARRLVELPDPIVVDEFTSVVDRQVAQIGSHALQKLVRKQGRKFIAVGCHYDVIDWLQPDWVLDMATRTFTRRLLQRRPPLECTIGRLPYSAWSLFAPYHYMSADLNRAARCFGLWVGDRLAAFTAIMSFPHPKVRDIMRVSRTVTLPDWQGLGLNMRLVSTLGAAYKGVGKRLRHYPAHPGLVRTLDGSPNWSIRKEPGTFHMPNTKSESTNYRGLGGRPCAVFEYVGDAMAASAATRLIG